MNFLHFLAEVTVGQDGKIDAGGTIPTVTGGNLVQSILNIVYFIVGIVAVGMIIYAGIQYLTANGEPDKAKKAMNTIIFSVVGLIVIIAAFAITNFVMNQLG